MFHAVRNITHKGMIHLIVRLFSPIKRSGVKKPHRQFDAVFHALSEYGLKTKEKDVLCHQNSGILPTNAEQWHFSLIFDRFYDNGSTFSRNKSYV